MDQGSLIETAEELYESAPCGYLSTLPDGTIIRVNQTFLTWIGMERQNLVGHRCVQDLLSIGGRIFYDTHLAPLLRMQGFVNEIAFDLTCAEGCVLPVLANMVQKRDAAGKPMVHRITLFNATDRRKYERELLLARQKAEQASEELRRLNETLEERVVHEVAERMKSEEALRQAQKMEAVGQLTGGIAHDFNNLLTIIVGNIELLQRRLPEDADRLQRAANHAMDATRRAATLTQRLLAFSRRQPLDPKPIDANKLVAGMSELLRRTLGEIIVLETVLAGGLWRTLADPNQLENAILNLAVNARDAMPDGGKLTIETANAHLDAAYVEALIEPVPAGQYVLVAVSDTGTGMDRVTRERVFEPFFTTKETAREPDSASAKYTASSVSPTGTSGSTASWGRARRPRSTCRDWSDRTRNLLNCRRRGRSWRRAPVRPSWWLKMNLPFEPIRSRLCMISAIAFSRPPMGKQPCQLWSSTLRLRCCSPTLSWQGA
jgi:PAS domain S-box-containing protein